MVIPVYKVIFWLLLMFIGVNSQIIDTIKSNIYSKDKIPIGDSIKIPILDFKNSDIKDVLRGLGIQYNLNVFVEPDVSGSVSLYLVNISVKDAIDFIVKKNNCTYTVENNIIKVFRNQIPPPPKPKLEFHLENDLLSIDLKDIPVRDVAKMFGDSAKTNVIIDGTADKLITARLVRIKPEKVVKALFETNGYDVATMDGIYYVTSKLIGNSADASNTSRFRPLSISMKDKLVSLEVDNAPLDQLIRSISVQSGINIVIYDALIGNITARLTSVPIDDALRFLLQNTKFTFWKENEIYFIGSREMNQQKTTAIIPLHHIRADESTISKILPPSVTNNSIIKYSTEQNSIIVIGSFDVVTLAQSFIEKIDRPVPQVLIEALVVDFNVNKIKEYGLSFFTKGVADSSGRAGNTYFPNIDITSGKATSERVLNKITAVHILSDVLDKIGASQIVSLPDNFRSSIHALESADIAKVHSTPQIATINGNTASIIIGETRYYKLQKETKTPNDNTSTVIGTDERFEVLKFNTQLEVTPWVMDDGYVMVKIRPEFNIPRKSSDNSIPPNVDTRVIESMVRLKDGQTIVLGGQRQSEDRVERSGVPILSRIPILGWLFSSRSVSNIETQMMIFLTPHVYYGDDNAVTPDTYFGKEINSMLNKYKVKKEKNKDTHKQNYNQKVYADDIAQDSISTEVKDSSTLSVANKSSKLSSPEMNIKLKNSDNNIVSKIQVDSSKIEIAGKNKRKSIFYRWFHKDSKDN